jgi:hypothetical protein
VNAAQRAEAAVFLSNLANNRIQYTLEHNRDEAVMVLIAVPGQRWEVEFFADGHEARSETRERRSSRRKLGGSKLRFVAEGTQFGASEPGL